MSVLLLEYYVFIPIPKKGNAKECSNYRTIAFISHANKVMLKILQARLQQYMNRELPEFKLVLEKAEEPDIKLPTSTGSSKKQESSRKSSISALLKILQEMRIPDHLICFLRNPYVDQAATVRTEHETTDWFQIGK